VRFDNASPRFQFHTTPLSVPSRLCGAQLAPPPARFPHLFSRTPGARFALPQKKNPSTALFIMLSMDSLFTTGPSWYRLRLIYNGVAREGKPAVSQARFSANGSGRALFERNSTLEHKKTPFALFC
jgi:hypothetical protein